MIPVITFAAFMIAAKVLKAANGFIKNYLPVLAQLVGAAFASLCF